jgi:DNA (cytosine-5)-methyltransferase 1
MSSSKKFITVSLFSGAMGLDLGLHSTGKYQLVACVEKEKMFCETIKTNIEKGNIDKGIRIYNEDIKKLDPVRMMQELGLKEGDLDLLVGGPPCQSFSTAGKRGTVQDPRGTLIWDYLRFVEAFKPKFFLMENVRGLMSAALKHRPILMRPDHGGIELNDDELPGSVVELFATDLSKLKGAKYHLDCYEVNSVNYGAPQIRERVIFIGNRYNLEMEFPTPTHVSPEEMPGVKNKLKPWATLGDAIKNLNEENPVILDFSPRKKDFLSQIPAGGNWRSLPIEKQMESMGKAFYAKGGRSGWWRRLSYDLPCPTLVTMPNHASTSLCHPEHVRALTLLEYCRIQEFPKKWILSGTTAEQYRQIGNAVPTRLGAVAGQVIARGLLIAKKTSVISKSKDVKPFRKIYLKSHIRTRKWFENGKAIIWDENKPFYKPMKTQRKQSALQEKKNA